MSKKRAFVRYTKSGEIVPGSLIITTNGGYPDKSSLWKEVTTDECCDGGGGCNCTSTTRTLSYTLSNPANLSTGFVIGCPIKSTEINDQGFMQNWIFDNGDDINALAAYLNLFYPIFGTWVASEIGTYGTITLQMNSCVAGLCSEQDMNFTIVIPA